jgi:transcriptional regulator with XRE-family HTH domain
MDNHLFNSAAEAFSALVEDENIKGQVQKELHRSKLVNALVQMRLHKKISQRQLADRMNCTPSKISRLEACDDDSIKIADVRDYVLGLNIGMAILFEDKDIPVAEQIKQHVFSIHEKLENLVKIAEGVDGDTEIITKINQFYGEVLMNFLKKFQDSHSRLCMVPGPDSSKKGLTSAPELIEHCEPEICL